jgi:hypothetical protein
MIHNPYNKIPILVTHKSSSASAKLYFFLTASHNHRVIKNTPNVELLYIVNDELISGLLKLGISQKNIFNSNNFHGHGSEEFERIFVNYSPNPSWFELLCFLRYFWALELCILKGYQQIIISDSDMLFFPALNNINLLSKSNSYLDFRDYIVNYDGESHKYIGGGLMMFTKEDLSNFCDYITQQYLEINNIENIYKQINNGGVCDMTLMTTWKKNNVFDLTFALNTVGLNFDKSIFQRLNGSSTNLQPRLIFDGILNNSNNLEVIVSSEEKSNLKLINLQFTGTSKNLIWGVFLYSKIIENASWLKNISFVANQKLLKIILLASQSRAVIFVSLHKFLTFLRNMHQ